MVKLLCEEESDGQLAKVASTNHECVPTGRLALAVVSVVVSTTVGVAPPIDTHTLYASKPALAAFGIPFHVNVTGEVATAPLAGAVSVGGLFAQRSTTVNVVPGE